MLYGVDVDEWVWRPDVRLLVGLIEFALHGGENEERLQ